MSGIKAFSSSLKHLKAPKDYPEAKNEQQFVTMTPAGYDKHGMDVVLKAHYPTGALPVVIDATQPSEDADRVISLTGHGMRQGDIIRFSTGSSLEGIESEVIERPDANTIVLATKLPSNPVPGVDTVEILRCVTLRTGSDGSLVATSGPLRFVRDGADTQVNKDTATPANTRALPVELVSTDGVEATFNVTTGDLNIASSHDGASATFDSIRIGDGTNLAGVNAANEILSRDGDAITALAALLTELQLKADLSETQPVSAASLPLPTGASTEATLEAARVLLASIDGKDFATQTTMAAVLADLQLKADLSETQPVSLASSPLPTGAATEATLEAARVLLASLDGKDYASQTTLAALLTELQLKADLSETQPVSATSLPLPTGAATETTLAAQSAKLPASLGSKPSADSLSIVLAADQSAIETAPKSEDGGNGGSLAIAGLTTLSALANQVKVLVQADVSNTETIRVTNGATDPSLTVGWELLPGASLVLDGAFDVKAFATSAKLNFIQTTRS